MDAHIRKVYVPMTETGFYILFSLRKENHGYGVVQEVERLTNGEIEYLVLYQHRSGTWSVPKGHIAAGESEFL